VLSTNLQSFAFLGDNFILGSTSVPAALLLYNLEQRPEDMTHDNTHLLRFLFGTHFQDPGGVSKILLASAPSPGWLPNAGQVPFQIAGDERMIALYSQFFDNWEDETFMIPMKTLLEQIEKLPIKEGLDVEWESYCPQLIEHVPDYTWEHGLLCSMFGMRYILPHLVLVDDKPMIVIRDVSPRRCLRASKEERKQSTTLYKAITSGPRRKPYPRSILKCVPLPESIVPYWNMILLISEDGIVIIDDVRHWKTCVFNAARLIPLVCREATSGVPGPCICSRSDELNLDRDDRLTGFVRVVSPDSFH
jgi:hypothetical protein